MDGPVRCLAASVETEDFSVGLLVYSASLDQTFKVWRLILQIRVTLKMWGLMITKKLWSASGIRFCPLRGLR